MSLEKTTSEIDELHEEEVLPHESLGEGGVSIEQRDRVLDLRETPRYRRLLQMLSPFPGETSGNLEEKRLLLSELRKISDEGTLDLLEARIGAQLLLNNIPEELPRRIELQEALWDADDADVPDLTERIRDLIRLRRSSIVPTEYLTGHPEDAERVNKMIDRVREYVLEVKNIIGEGNAAWVFRDPEFPELCAKVIKQASIGGLGSNTLSQEASYMDDIYDLEVEGVRSPLPYAIINDPGLQIIIMECLPAVSVGDLVKGIASLPRPEEFDVEKFASGVARYFKKMHERDLIHFDPHEGNVMIDFDTHTARVIDFGKTKRIQGFGDEEARVEQYKKSDMGQLGKTIEMLREWKKQNLTNN